MAALDKIFELLDEEPDMEEAPDAVDLDAAAGRDRVRGRHVPVRDGEAARSRPEAPVAPGETVALVGATGAGKSTFAKLVARFHDPNEGRVLVDGHDLRDVSRASLRAQMGIVPQEGFLFSGTVADNIAFGRPDATREVRGGGARGRGDEFIAAARDGCYRRSASGRSLSAGQRQLVAFARALIADPRILILDEATANLDVATESRIEAGMGGVVEGRTTMVIAHRLSATSRPTGSP